MEVGFYTIDDQREGPGYTRYLITPDTEEAMQQSYHDYTLGYPEDEEPEEYDEWYHECGVQEATEDWIAVHIENKLAPDNRFFLDRIDEDTWVLYVYKD